MITISEFEQVYKALQYSEELTLKNLILHPIVNALPQFTWGLKKYSASGYRLMGTNKPEPDRIIHIFWSLTDGSQFEIYESGDFKERSEIFQSFGTMTYQLTSTLFNIGWI